MVHLTASKLRTISRVRKSLLLQALGRSEAIYCGKVPFRNEWVCPDTDASESESNDERCLGWGGVVFKTQTHTGSRRKCPLPRAYLVLREASVSPTRARGQRLRAVQLRWE